MRKNALILEKKAVRNATALGALPAIPCWPSVAGASPRPRGCYSIIPLQLSVKAHGSSVRAFYCCRRKIVLLKI